MKNFIADLKFISGKVLGQIVLASFTGFFLLQFVQIVLDVSIFKIAIQKPYIYYVGIIMIAYVLYLIKYIFVLKHCCDFARLSIKAIEDHSESLCKEIIEAKLDVLSVKISILKSFSPIPVIVLIVGAFIDPEKYEPLTLNYFTITIIACIFFYVVSLYKSFLLYGLYRDELISYRSRKQAESK